MSESKCSLDQLQEILELFRSSGYSRAQDSSVSALDNVLGGLAWCIAANNSTATDLDDVILRDQTELGEAIGAALKSMECPYPIQVQQIQLLDYKAIYPVVQWLISRCLTIQASIRNEAAFLEHEIEEEENNVHKLKKLLTDEENSVKMLHAELEKQNQKNTNFMNEIQYQHARIDKEGANDMVQRLKSLLELLKTLEKKESDFQSFRKQESSYLQTEVLEMEKKLFNDNGSNSNANDPYHSLTDAVEKLNLAKTELAVKLRENLLLKRRLDDIPAQSELIQYEHRFSELYVQIQEKLRQTRKYYATYNALLEIKELMLKEISLLNSICSQFQDAMTSTNGRVKLIDSMERIVTGTQQKLEKVQLGLLTEQKACDTLREKYAAKITEQRHRSYLLKAFQEECARSEKLQSLNAM